jgi:DNA-binding CsgD family transcriptional regulator
MLPAHGFCRCSRCLDAVLFGVWHGPAYDVMKSGPFPGVRPYVIRDARLRVPTANGSPIRSPCSDRGLLPDEIIEAMAESQPLDDAGISRREGEVLALVGEHLTNAEIADRLYISVRTVESHVSSLLRKLDLTDRRELAHLASARAETPHRGQPVAPVHYTRSDDLNIAYQITGTGDVDLVLVAGFVSHLTLDWTERRHAHFLDRLGAFSRLIRFDKRGTGMSDRPGALPDLETRMGDLAAVMDAARSERAVLFGYSEGGPMSILYAASYPERVHALVLYSSYARRLWAPDYPWGPRPEERARYAAQLEQDWAWEADMRHMCPNADQELARWWGER